MTWHPEPPIPYKNMGFEDEAVRAFMDDTVPPWLRNVVYSNECITDDPQASIPSSNKSLELTSGMLGDVPPMMQTVDLIEVT